MRSSRLNESSVSIKSAKSLKSVKNEPIQQELREAFNLFDNQHTGEITSTELKVEFKTYLKYILILI